MLKFFNKYSSSLWRRKPGKIVFLDCWATGTETELIVFVTKLQKGQSNHIEKTLCNSDASVK